MTESDPSVIEEILEDIGAEHDAWIELTRRSSSEELMKRPANGWSLIDMLLHVASWKENATGVARLQAEPHAPFPAQELTPAGVLGIDEKLFNQDFMDAHRAWRLEQAVEWSNQVHRGLLQALNDLREERVLGGKGPRGARLWYWSPAVIVSSHHRREAEDRLGRQ